MINKKKFILAVLVGFVFFSIVPAAHAQTTTDNANSLDDVPKVLNNNLFDSDGDGVGENLVAAQILLVAAIVFATVLPLAIAQPPMWAYAVVIFLDLSMCTAFGWLPSITLLLIALLIAALWGRNIAEWLTGRGKQ